MRVNWRTRLRWWIQDPEVLRGLSDAVGWLVVGWIAVGTFLLGMWLASVP